MDKLQPLIAHRFWICFGIAVIIAPVGHYMASGELDEKTAAKTSEVEGKFNNIPNEQKISESYNQTIIKSFEKLNAEQKKLVDNATGRLRTTQKKYMTWPKEVSDGMSKLNYRQAPPNPNLTYFYAQAYPSELARLRKIVTPFDPKTGEGKLQVPSGVLPTANTSTWSSLLPKSDDIWDAQEDVWLTQSILEAVAAVNKQADNITEAPIKAMMRLSLHGGKRSIVLNPTPATAGAAGKADTGRRGPVMAAGARTSISFLPGEEFGPEEGEKVVKSNAPDDDDRRGRGMQLKKPRDRSDDGEETKRRYIDHVKTNPYRLRGFYLEVAIDHQYLPELLAQLSNMPWPTEIVRWQRGVNVQAMVPYEAKPPEETKKSGTGPAVTPFAGGGFRKGDDQDENRDRTRVPGGAAAKSVFDRPARMFYAALDDPNVVVVALAGVMTIYPPPDTPPPPKAALPGALPKPGATPGKATPGKGAPTATPGAPAPSAAAPGAATAKAGDIKPAEAKGPAAAPAAAKANPPEGSAPKAPVTPAPAAQPQPPATNEIPPGPAPAAAPTKADAPAAAPAGAPSEPDKASGEKK